MRARREGGVPLTRLPATGKNTVFGRVIGGQEVLDAMEKARAVHLV